MADDDVKDSSLEKLEDAWSKVFIAEFIVIVIINVLTLVAFARNRHLRKRTTYLIINLTVADLLVGAVSGSLVIFDPDFDDRHGSRWQEFIFTTLGLIFPLASEANLSLISLERLHATLFPFRHCLIDKWLYFKVITGSWMITLLLASMLSVLEEFELGQLVQYAIACYTFLTLLIITVSNVIIAIKVKSNPPPQHSSTVASERRLTVTLSIVTVVSFLTILPGTIWMIIEQYILNHMSPAAFIEIDETLELLYYANSIVNPLIYAIRIQEFRKAVKELICKRSALTRDVERIELHAT